MKHPSETELIAYRDGNSHTNSTVDAHLQECAECREEMQRIEAVYAALDAVPVPDPGDDYALRLWQQISPKLDQRRPRWWEHLFQTQRLVLAGAFAAMLVLAFWLGRHTNKPAPDSQIAANGNVRQGVLLVAVADHLGKLEMVLVELSNTEPPKGQNMVNISAEQKRAEDLLSENRLYRQTALRDGDTAMATTLDELERVLLDIANSPDEITPAQFESLQKRITSRGILFKVRVVHKDVQEKQRARVSAPPQQSSGFSERNKT